MVTPRWGPLWVGLLFTASAEARPVGPQVFCTVYPEAPACAEGAAACATCHVTPPDLNPYGAAVADALVRPVSDDASFSARLPDALTAVERLDSDGDGVANVAEISNGSAPGVVDAPGSAGCQTAGVREGFLLCAYDPLFALERVALDVCGVRSSPEERARLAGSTEPVEEVLAKLRACLDSDHWLGVDGQLWQLAFPKVRPRVPFARAAGAFEPDLNLFVWTQTDDRDARELLTATYDVERDDGARPPRYRAVVPSGPRAPDPARRAGMLTTQWFNASNTMGQALPRVTAAQAYRAYLGYDLSRFVGIFDPVDAMGLPRPVVDYDDKGIDAEECAACHRTLDPLAYLFSRYAGAAESRIFREARPRPPQPGRYAPNRMEYFIGYDGGPALAAVPETGALFGEGDYTLPEWAAAAANSEAFARHLVAGYWARLVGAPPGAEDIEFEALWRDFMTVHDYRVERMLEALVQTEAYGVR